MEGVGQPGFLHVFTVVVGLQKLLLAIFNHGTVAVAEDFRHQLLTVAIETQDLSRGREAHRDEVLDVVRLFRGFHGETTVPQPVALAVELHDYGMCIGISAEYGVGRTAVVHRAVSWIVGFAQIVVAVALLDDVVAGQQIVEKHLLVVLLRLGFATLHLRLLPVAHVASEVRQVEEVVKSDEVEVLPAQSGKEDAVSRPAPFALGIGASDKEGAAGL